MAGYAGIAVVLLLACAAVAACYAAGLVVGVARTPLRVAPWSGGVLPAEHPLSRFHVRWYAMTLVFLAFDVEMLFMYPWAVVVSEVGRSAVVEMFGFLALLLVGVAYAWREGAFRWA